MYLYRDTNSLVPKPSRKELGLQALRPDDHPTKPRADPAAFLNPVL